MNRRQVFGIGLPKTGTTTLKAALERLGYARVADFDMRDCERFLLGDFEGLTGKLADHDAAQDWPWPLMYQPLSRAYPDALFVLTVREDEDTWFRSMAAHAGRMRGTRRAPGMRQHVFGYEDPADAPEHHMRFYREHNDAVRNWFRDKGTLLEVCWARQDGWAALCGALDLPRPDEPFPHMYKSRA